MDKLDTAVIGALGLGATAVVPEAFDLQGAINALVQVVIGVATLIGLFRPRKK